MDAPKPKAISDRDEVEATLREDLALANHILVNEGVLDGFGHVSARDPLDPTRFYLSRNMAPALVHPDDIRIFDLDGNIVNSEPVSVYLERFIHSSIYKARPDASGIVHSHSASVVPFSVSKNTQLRPICHMAGFLRNYAPVYEIRDHAGQSSDLLIKNPELGDSLATCLDQHSIVLMRGHGVTVVGRDLRQTVFRAIYTERNASIQSAAHFLGESTFLTESEAISADEANSGQVDRAWNYWVHQVVNAR